MKTSVWLLGGLILLSFSGCGKYDPFESKDVNHSPDHFPPKPPVQMRVDDPELQESDTIEIEALKIAAAQTEGNARNYYAYQERWRPGAMNQDIAYLNYLLANPNEANKITVGFWRAALDAYVLRQNLRLHNNLTIASMAGLRIVHAKGSHQCWSREAIGYTCEVENRMYTDCQEAVTKLRETNCCKFKYPDGVSNMYVHGSCY